MPRSVALNIGVGGKCTAGWCQLSRSESVQTVLSVTWPVGEVSSAFGSFVQ